MYLFLIPFFFPSEILDFNNLLAAHVIFSSVCTFLDWKTKLEECKKEMQDWKNQTSKATTSISKINRQISSKVSFDGDFFSYVLTFVLMNFNAQQMFPCYFRRHK